MSRERELVKNTGLLSLGAFVPKLVAIVVSPILTDQLSKPEYGIYDLIVTVVALLFPAATLEITTAAFRFLIDGKKDRERARQIISTIYGFVVCTGMLISAVFLLLAGAGIASPEISSNRYLILLYFLFDILLIATEQILRGLGKTFMYSLSYMVRSITNLILVMALLGALGGTNYGLTGVLISMTTSTGIALITVFLGGRVYSYFSVSAISLRTLREMLKYSWPMVPNNLSGWVLRLSDRLVITGVLGINMQAVYAAANKLPTFFQLFQSTFTLAWQENASIAVNDKDKSSYYSQMLNTVADMLIGVMAVLLACSPLLFPLLIRGDYGEAYYQLPVLYAAMIFSCLSAVLGGIYIAYKNTVSVGISTMAAAAINLVIDLALVWFIGIWAGSVSTLVSYIVLFIYRMYNIQRFQPIRLNTKRFITGILMLIPLSVIFMFKSPVLNLVNAALAVVIVVLFDRKVISLFIGMLKRFLKR